MDKKTIAGITTVAVMLLLLVALPAIGGCAPKETAPPPEKVIKPSEIMLYAFGDMSGPLAPVSGPIMMALTDFCNWYNEEKGGVDGVPLKVTGRDTEYKLDLAISAYNAFREAKPKPLVFYTWGSAESEALAQRYREDEIVAYMFCLTTKAIYPAGYMFMFCPGYADTCGAFIDWVVDVWQKKTGEKVKLAFCTWDNAYGRGPLVPEVRDYAKKKGVEIVAEEVFPVTGLDATTQMRRIKDAGANWVYDNTLGNGPGVVSKSAAELGILSMDPYDTTPGKIHRATGPFPGGSDTATIKLAPDVTEGMIMHSAYASWSEVDNPGIQLALNVMKKNNRGTETQVAGYLCGIPGVYVIGEALNRAVDTVGWNNLSGKAVREQLEKMNNFDVMGLGRVTYSADKHEARQLRVFQVKGGKLLPITDYVTCPDLRPAQ